MFALSCAPAEDHEDHVAEHLHSESHRSRFGRLGAVPVRARRRRSPARFRPDPRREVRALGN